MSEKQPLKTRRQLSANSIQCAHVPNKARKDQRCSDSSDQRMRIGSTPSIENYKFGFMEFEGNPSRKFERYRAHSRVRGRIRGVCPTVRARNGNEPVRHSRVPNRTGELEIRTKNSFLLRILGRLSWARFFKARLG